MTITVYWVLEQLTWTDPPTYVQFNPGGSQFTQNVAQAMRFKDKRDAVNWLEFYARDWPHKPTPKLLADVKEETA